MSGGAKAIEANSARRARLPVSQQETRNNGNEVTQSRNERLLHAGECPGARRRKRIRCTSVDRRAASIRQPDLRRQHGPPARGYRENYATATAGADGKWRARIQPPPAGGPYTVKIAGGQQPVELREVLVGDVRICSGQSNMQFGLRQARNE
jgi:hypothetical protein